MGRTVTRVCIASDTVTAVTQWRFQSTEVVFQICARHGALLGLELLSSSTPCANKDDVMRAVELAHPCCNVAVAQRPFRTVPGW